MTNLQKILGSLLLSAAAVSVPAHAQIQPETLQQQQAQTQATLNEQNAQAQANNQQLRQNMAQDRQRTQQLFHPPQPVAPPAPAPKPK